MSQKKHTLYLLDTNIVSHIIKNTLPSLREKLAAIPMTELCVSAITEAEIRYGLVKKPEAKKLAGLVEAFLERVEVLPWDSGAAEAYGALRVELEKKGKPLSNLDLLIAAQAISVKATLVTADKAFSQVKALSICDWSKP